MYTAKYEGKEIGRSDNVEKVEGNIYFPKEDLNMNLFEKTQKQTTCPWKGKASYYTLHIDDTTLENVAWTYEDPKDAASEIKDHVAFYSDVDVVEE